MTDKKQKVVAWSYSRLNSFEQCPKKFWHLSVEKDYKEPPTEAMEYGKRVHKALELRIGKGTPLPVDLKDLEPIAKRFADAPGEKFVENQLALNVNLKPTGWFDNDVWARCIVDLAIVAKDQKRALLVDWKTGRMSDDFTQQQAAAAIFHRFHGYLEEIDLMYYWIKEGKPTVDTLKAEDIKHVWASLVKRIQKYNRAHLIQEFPPRPSGLCKRHCPIVGCPHNGRAG